MDELAAAIRKLKNGKAGGSSCMLPEKVKTGCCRRESETKRGTNMWRKGQKQCLSS